MDWRRTLVIVCLSLFCLGANQFVAATECENESCSFKSTAIIKEGEFFSSEKINGLLGAELYVNVDVMKCENKDIVGCFVSIFLVTDEQFDQFAQVTNPKDIPNLKFLERNTNYFPNVTLSQNFTTYFQRYSPLPIRVLIFLQSYYTPPMLVVTVDYDIQYKYDTCMSAIVLSYGFFLGLVLLITATCVALTIIRDRKAKLMAENAVNQAEEREKEKLDRYHEDRRLRQQKSDSKWWINKPFIAPLQCNMRIVEKPNYIFFPYHWIFTHDWLSIVKRSPSEEMSRTNLLLIAVTKLTLGLAILTLWAAPVTNVTSGTIRSVAPFEWTELIVDLFSKSLVVWIIQEVVGIFYPYFVLFCQRKGKVENHIVIGGSEYELTALDYATPKWKTVCFFVLYHMPAIVLAVLVLTTCVGVIIFLTDKLSFNCWSLAGIWIQMLVIEVMYKSIFPGFFLSWLKYLFANTFGNASVLMSPYGEEEGPLVTAFEGEAKE